MIPKHGGYRNLKTFQLATAICDITVRFCEKYLDSRSRTVDQMTQAARSGRQNIAEGSVDSGTSKKIEMKLTGIAKGSLEELRLDYEDCLRQRGLPQWDKEHPALVRFRALRCASLETFRRWVAEEMKRGATQRGKDTGGDGKDVDKPGKARTDDIGRQGVRVRRQRRAFVAESVRLPPGASIEGASGDFRKGRRFHRAPLPRPKRGETAEKLSSFPRLDNPPRSRLKCGACTN